MKVYVFPGQGSQKKGMGDTLFNEYSDLVSKADTILGYSIKKLCLEDPNDQLNQTQYTQPALFIVNAFTYLKKIERTNIMPDFVVGHSVGEYNALFASGVFDFENGIRLVKKRGELMAKASNGGMAAVIGLSENRINDLIKENNFKIQIANFNSPSQIVISGLKEDIIKAQSIFVASEAKMYVPLNVSGAFHTSYMNAAKVEFEKFLNNFNFSEIKIPVISNFNARPYKQEKIKDTLANQINHPVKWTESIQYLMTKDSGMEFEEVGVGRVLTGLINSIKRVVVN